jgi:hypothetical protein
MVGSTVDASIREQFSTPTVHAVVDFKHVTVQHANISEQVTLQHYNISEHVTPSTGEHCVSWLFPPKLAGLAEFCTGSMIEQYCPRIRIGIEFKLVDSQSVLIDTVAVLRTLNCDVTVMISGDVSNNTKSVSPESHIQHINTHTIHTPTTQ